MSNAEVLVKLEPILSLCRTLDLNDPRGSEKRLEEAFPFESADVGALGELCVRGLNEGWLCDRGDGDVRYSRVVKPDGAGQTVSVDAVLMTGPGPGHRHPKGEIDLCFVHDGEPAFDGRAPGWVVYHEGSEHVPTVAGGTMLILYILPDGRIEWL